MSVLKAALIRAGYTVKALNNENTALQFTKGYESGTFQNGTFTVPRDFNLQPIKTEYSKEAVERAASKYSWSVKKMTPNKYELTRRAF